MIPGSAKDICGGAGCRQHPGRTSPSVARGSSLAGGAFVFLIFQLVGRPVALPAPGVCVAQRWVLQRVGHAPQGGVAAEGERRLQGCTRGHRLWPAGRAGGTLTPCHRGRSRGQRACAETPRCPGRSSPAGRIGQGLLQRQAGCSLTPREASHPSPQEHTGEPAGSQGTLSLPACPQTQEKPRVSRNEPCLTAPGSLAAARGTHGCTTGQKMLRGKGESGGKPSGMGVN